MAGAPALRFRRYGRTGCPSSGLPTQAPTRDVSAGVPSTAAVARWVQLVRWVAGGVAAGLVLLRRHRISIVPVHPTQLYETLALLQVAWMLLRWRRDRRSDSFVLAAHLASAGLVRFGIEFLRAQQPLVGPLALAHLFAFVAICVGLALICRSWSIAIADGRDDSEA